MNIDIAKCASFSSAEFRQQDMKCKNKPAGCVYYANLLSRTCREDVSEGNSSINQTETSDCMTSLCELLKGASPLNSTRCVWCISASKRQWSFSSSQCVFLLCCSGNPVIPPQQIQEASVFAGCRSTTQQFSTEQIEWDTDTTLQHLVNFRIKHFVLTLD